MEARSLLKWGALGLMGLGVLVHLLLGIGETFGDFPEGNGWIHFIPAAILTVLVLLAARHPFRVGLVLLAVAASLAVLVVLAALGGDAAWAGLLLVVPPLVAGALLIAVSRRPGQSSTSEPDSDPGGAS